MGYMTIINSLSNSHLATEAFVAPPGKPKITCNLGHNLCSSSYVAHFLPFNTSNGDEVAPDEDDGSSEPQLKSNVSNLTCEFYGTDYDRIFVR